MKTNNTEEKYTVDTDPFEEDEEPTWLVKQREDANGINIMIKNLKESKLGFYRL